MTGIPDRPNVLVLTIDALRSDRTGFGGYGRPTTPHLDRLAADGTVCENAFSLGPFTLSACAQIFTASRPLSYGGYDGGVDRRPTTLFKHFRDNGYRTTAVSVLHWVNRFLGYGDGFDEEIILSTLNSLVGVTVALTRNSIVRYRSGAIDADEFLRAVSPHIRKLFDDVEAYCAIMAANGETYRRDYPDSFLVNSGYDYTRIEKIVVRHRNNFAHDPQAYVDKYLQGVPRAHEWLGREWRYARSWGRLTDEIAFRAGNRLLAAFDPRLAQARQHRFKSYVDSSSVADRLCRQIRTHDRSRPFLIWAHFMDTHIPYVSGRGRDWYRQTPRYLRELGYDGEIAPALTFEVKKPRNAVESEAFSALYDASIRFTDESIGSILRTLDECGLADKTVVAVCGDHGEELGEHGDYGHNFLFFDHNIHVPMIFRGGSAKRNHRLAGLTTSLDFAPSIATFAGLAPDPKWEGDSVDSSSVAGRPHIVMESFFGSPCDFSDRPLYMGVRTRRHKYLWRERRDPHDRISPEGPELFDLIEDPGETHNLYSHDHPLVGGFNRAIVDRLAEIPEIAPGRIASAFPEPFTAPGMAASNGTRS